MRPRTLHLMHAAAVIVGVVATTAPGSAQDARLEGRIPPPARSEIESLLDTARATGLPTEPLIDRALEGASKGADTELIVAAVRRLAGELRAARDAMGSESSAAEIVAGASALRAGAHPDDLTFLRDLRERQSLTIAAAVLADLVAVGVPVDTAAAAVIALAQITDDGEYLAFRRNVERDIALGASPITALGVRLAAAAGDLETGQLPQRPTRPRKP